jgi:hypothetical protein
MDINQASAIDLLGSPLDENATWEDMVTAFAQVMYANVEGPTDQLELIRYISDNMDPVMLNNTVRMLGFDVKQDVLSLNSSTLTKLATQIPMYSDQNGTILFKNFIDLILNANNSTIDYLYTKDYVNFYTQPNGALIETGGAWFKVTHINLTMEILSLNSVNLLGASVVNRILEIFYNFCPIALVINKFIFVISFPDSSWLGGSAFGIGAAMPYYIKTVVVE